MTQAATVSATRQGRLPRWLQGRSRLVGFILLAILYGTIAAASFTGFYEKWGLRDDYEGMSFVEMIEGTAKKPFVHRQMLPTMANAIDAALPASVKERIVEQLEKPVWWERYRLADRLKLDFAAHRDYTIQYYAIYYACVFFLFLSLFVMREICLNVGMGKTASTIAPGIFGLCLVYLFSMGGFFYDFPDIFFMSLAVLWALKGRWLWLVPLTFVASFNKEAFLIFTLTLFPLLLERYRLVKAGMITGLLAGCAGVTYLAIRAHYANNPGAPIEFWFFQSIEFYLNPRNLFAFETNYAIVTPRAYSLFWMIVVAVIYVTAWSKLSLPIKRHIALSAAVTVPLVLAFCGPGEVRNYSMCYIGLLIVIAQNVKDWLKRAEERVSPPGPDQAG